MESIKEQKKLCIIYHYPCFDGSLGAINTFLYYHNFAKNQYEVTFMPLKNIYPCFSRVQEKYNKIIILDLFFKPEDINFLTDESNNEVSITIFDHHLTGFERFNKDFKEKIKERKKLKIFFDEKNIKSACGLSFDYYKKKSLEKENADKEKVERIFNDNVKTINLYIEDSDTGNNKIKNIEQFKCAISKELAPLKKIADFTYNTKDKMKRFLQLTPSYLVKIGEKLLKRFKKEAKQVLNKNYIYIVELQGGLKFLCCITEEKYVRNIACPLLGKISLKYGYLPVGAFVYKYENGLYKFSMRTSEKDIYDVSKIAELYGGGGHKNAAAFEMDYDGIDNLIVNTIDVYREINSIPI